MIECETCADSTVCPLYGYARLNIDSCSSDENRTTTPCGMCPHPYQITDDSGNGCANDGIPTWIISGYMGLYLTVGFLRIMVTNFIGGEEDISATGTHDICCCGDKRGSAYQIDCLRDETEFTHTVRSTPTAEACPAGQAFFTFAIASTEYATTNVDEDVCAIYQAEKKQGMSRLFHVLSRNTLFGRVARWGLIGLALASVVGGFLAVMKEEYSIIIFALACVYILVKVVVTILNLRNLLKKHKKVSHVIIYGLVSAFVDALACGWLAYRLYRTSYRGMDLSLMWILQLGIQFQIGVLADRAFSATGTSMHRTSFLMIIATVLMEAISFPFAIAMRIFTWPRESEEIPVYAPELTNLHYMADYFGMAMAGFNIAIAVVQKANDKLAEMSDKRNNYKAHLNYFKYDIQFFHYSPEAMQTQCEALANHPSIAKEPDIMTNVRAVITQLMFKLEREDSCKFFTSRMAERKSAIQKRAVGLWKALDSNTDPATGQRPVVCKKDMEPLIEAMADHEMHSLSLADICFNLKNIVETIDDYIIGLTKSNQVHMFSQELMFMALIADAYYGAVYNTIDMANAIRDLHGGDRGDGFVNSIVTAGFGFMAAAGAFIVVAFPLSNDRE